MKLSCRQTEISIISVTKSKVVADRGSMRDVQKYCDEHEKKISVVEGNDDNDGVYSIGDSSSTKVSTCSLSLQLVYDTDDTVYEDGFTEILYTCL